MNKLPAYSSYTDTDIDWIEKYPSHWQLIPCRAVVDHIVEKNEGGKIQNYLSLMANVGVIRYEDKGDVGNKKPEDLSKCKIVKKGQLVINSMNYSIGSYGMSPYDGVCSSVYIILEPKKSLLNRYCLRVFENSAFQKHLATFGNGILAHRAAIGWDDIKGEYIPLAPMDEQKNIINFLDFETAQIDTLIEKQQTLIQLLKEKRQAVISHAVTKGLNPDVPMKESGVEWLGKVPEHWEVMPLKYAVTFQRGHDLPAQNRTAGDIPLVTSAGISSTHNIAIAKAPGLVTGRYGTIGKFNLLEEDYWPLNTTLYSINLRSNNPKYLWYMLHNLTPIFLANSLKSAVPGVDRNDLHVVKVAMPKNLDEQEALCDYLEKTHSKYDLVIEKASESLVLLQERRTALISAAVTGKIDVRGWQAPESKTTLESL